MHSHQRLTKPDSSPGLVTSFPPQRIQASPQTELTSESGERDLKAERERAERLGHHFSRVKVLSDRRPIDPVQQFQLSIQKQVTSQQDPQAEAEGQSSLSEQEKTTLISVLQEIREVSLPTADFVSGAVYQWLYNNGETGRWLLQASSPEWREIDQQAEAALPDSEAFELGRSLGDGASVITGLAEMGKGGGAIAGGGTLCAVGAALTAGGSCLAGGAVVAVGSALVVHGAGTTSAGVQGLAERLGIFFSKKEKEPGAIDSDETVKDLRQGQQSLSKGRRIPPNSSNAADALNRNYRTVERAQERAVRTRQLPDGRIRYYEAEVPARNPGPTRGASLVTEYDPTTGRVRTWYESYDQPGNVNRVHPKSENGLPVNSSHFPPTEKELGL